MKINEYMETLGYNSEIVSGDTYHFPCENTWMNRHKYNVQTLKCNSEGTGGCVDSSNSHRYAALGKKQMNA